MVNQWRLKKLTCFWRNVIDSVMVNQWRHKKRNIILSWEEGQWGRHTEQNISEASSVISHSLVHLLPINQLAPVWERSSRDPLQCWLLSGLLSFSSPHPKPLPFSESQWFTFSCVVWRGNILKRNSVRFSREGSFHIQRTITRSDR